jgi:hypothetical protein
MKGRLARFLWLAAAHSACEDDFDAGFGPPR